MILSQDDLARFWHRTPRFKQHCRTASPPQTMASVAISG
jgi:hypothetical protein